MQTCVDDDLPPANSDSYTRGRCPDRPEQRKLVSSLVDCVNWIYIVIYSAALAFYYALCICSLLSRVNKTREILTHHL